MDAITATQRKTVLSRRGKIPIELGANSVTQFNAPDTSSPRLTVRQLGRSSGINGITSSSPVSNNVYDWTATLKAALHRIRGALSSFAARVNILIQPMNRVAAQGFESRERTIEISTIIARVLFEEEILESVTPVID